MTSEGSCATEDSISSLPFVTIFKGLGVGTQHLVFNIALRVEVVERTRHKEDLIQLNVLISLSQSH